jgi:hypothetical protein
MKFIFLAYKPRHSVYHFFGKKNSYVDPEKKKIRVYQPSKLALGSLCAVVLFGVYQVFQSSETAVELENK